MWHCDIEGHKKVYYYDYVGLLIQSWNFQGKTKRLE